MKKLFLTISIFLFLILGTTIFIFQTTYFQEKVKSSILKYIKEKNLPIEIGSLEISFPLKCRFTNLKIEKTLKIEKGEFTVNIFALLIKKLSFPYLNMEEIEIEKRENNKQSFTLPISISVNKLNLKNIYFDSQIFSIKGKIDLKKDLKNIFLDLKITEKKLETSYVNIFFKGSQKDNTTYSIIKMSLDNFYSNSIYLEIKSAPSFEELKNFIFSKEEKTLLLTSSGYLSSKKLKKYFQKKFNTNFSLKLSNKLDFNFYDFQIKNNFINIFGNFDIKDFKIQSINLNIKSKNINIFNPLLKIPINGIFKAKLKKIDENIIFSSNIKNFKIRDIKIKNHKTIISLKDNLKEKILSGNILTTAFLLEENLKISSDFIWNILTPLSLKNISISSSSFEGMGDIEINKFLKGTFKSKFKNLKFLKTILQNRFKENFSSLEGILDSSLIFSQEKDIQNLLINLSLKDYFSTYLQGDKLTIDLTINNLFTKPKFFLLTNIENSKHKYLDIKKLSLKTEFIIDNLKNPYEFSLNSSLNIKSSGYWNYFSKKLKVEMEDTELLIKKQKIKDENTEFLFSKNLLILKNLNLEGENFYLKTDIEITKGKNNISITTNNFPLDLLFPKLPTNYLFPGTVSSNIFLKDDVGKIDLSLKNSKINGQIYASLEKKELSIDGKFFQNDKKFLDIDGKIPIILQFFPFQLNIIKNLPLNINSSLEGKAEKFLNLIDLKNHDLTGDIRSNFSISNTLEKLKINGFLEIKNGTYENYISNLSLNDLSANFIFQKDKIILSSLNGKGINGGTISATGEILVKKNIPFLLNFELKDIYILQNETIKANSTGNIEIQGDKNQALAIGNLLINKGNITIPEKLPYQPPKLDIHFINKPPKTIKKIKKLFILNLDLTLSTTDLIFIKGRGLTAQLKGKGKVIGSSQNPLIDGKLELIKGDFLFSGRSFKLKEGILIFEGKPDIKPYLSIKAETVQKGVLLIASLKGKINELTLSFSSIPPLPLSSIVSLIMFGEELSSISATQALQITSTLDSLYKESEIEGKQKTLGIDRVAVVSPSTNDLEDPDKVSIQIGKYVTKGVLVSYSQGTEEGTSNASISIDLGLGFALELETIQEEEQNKATIKWSKNF